MKNNKALNLKWKIIGILILIIVIIGGYFLIFGKDSFLKSSFSNLTDFLEKPALFSTNNTEIKNNAEDKATNDNNQVDNNQKEIILPDKIDLEVPFLTQAPLTNWDDLHNEACEEASVVGVVQYLENFQTISAEEAEDKIQKLVVWQIENFNGHYDLPAKKVAEMIEKYFKRKTLIYYDADVTIDSIKKNLNQNNPVIVPLAGRLINNPYYRQPGPVYHMLIIRGYDDKKQQFITNDVGTKRGEGFRYNYQTLYNAIHDMPLWQQNKTILDVNPEMIFSGRKSMLVIR